MTAPEHNHFADGVFRGKGSDNPCARCILEHAAPRMYDALRLFVDWHDTLLKGNTKKISVQRMHRFVSIAQDAINEIEGRE